ncbi:hypothetical protein TNCT_73791 [Trichonephila clavata]|uniref:Uncharacterized protein n=1 Tax=Trichonephila clavata TaxID=2740835 RepID=A0A8X6ICU2_TRICU|nr:hypothetical protein TNCT_73791 [Trichonephila clavata]
MLFNQKISGHSTPFPKGPIGLTSKDFRAYSTVYLMFLQSYFLKSNDRLPNCFKRYPAFDAEIRTTEKNTKPNPKLKISWYLLILLNGTMIQDTLT